MGDAHINSTSLIDVFPAPEDGSQAAALLLETSETILQIAEVLRSQETDDRRKAFYSHLGFHCARYRDHVQHVDRASLDGKHVQCINQILGHFGALVPEHGIQELPNYRVSLSFRLRALNLHWGGIQSQAGESKSDFGRRWLNFEAADELDNQLEEAGDVLIAQRRRVPEKTSDTLALVKTSEPSYAVWKAAQSIYDALVDSEACTCPDQHQFGVKLSLGTYRKPAQNPARKAFRKSSRNATVDVDAAGELDFDIFLSMERDWREVRVQTAKERVVRMALPSDPDNDSKKRKRSETPRPKTLCKRIAEIKKRELQRLVLKLTKGQLFELRFERSNFRIDRNAEPISLLRCFEERHHFFTEKTKRVLSLILSYAVLHLHGTSWLPPGWGSSNIRFFQTTTSKTPLRPFIQTQLPKSGPDDLSDGFQLLVDGVGYDGGCWARDEDGAGQMGLDPEHRCPALVALAVVLMEIYFVTPFKTLAKNHGVELLEEQSGRVAHVDALLVFYGDEEDGIEGCRSQIPEDCPLVYAIEKCLDGGVWEDEDGNELDNQSLRPIIYREVVRPLEAHLSSGFSQISLEGIDKYAQGLDFGNWGQPILSHESEGYVPRQLASEVSQGRTPSPGAVSQFYPPAGVQSLFQQPQGPPFWDQRLPPYGIQNLSSIPKPEVTAMNEQEHKKMAFFDDEAVDGECFLAGKMYLRWRANYDSVYEKFISAKPTPTKPAVKIAILDTGIDLGHQAIEARRSNIREMANWYNQGVKRVPDRNGHGTFAASLLLDYAPDAELYIAKIADKENTMSDGSIVAKAIHHAVTEWKVDIISMSFGWPTRSIPGFSELQAAINTASEQNVIMFAAASNSGGRQGRAYPASSPKVICVHSTDVNGGRSSFSPTASPDRINLATVGESIQSAWPESFCDDSNPECVKYKSGTSYATPIAAGIGAFLMQYARLHLTADAAEMMKQQDRMEAVLKRIAERGLSYRPRDDYYYIELSRSPANLFGKEKKFVDLTIEDILMNMN